jgi:hypothetical protein
MYRQKLSTLRNELYCEVWLLCSLSLCLCLKSLLMHLWKLLADWKIDFDQKSTCQSITSAKETKPTNRSTSRLFVPPPTTVRYRIANTFRRHSSSSGYFSQQHQQWKDGILCKESSSISPIGSFFNQTDSNEMKPNRMSIVLEQLNNKILKTEQIGWIMTQKGSFDKKSKKTRPHRLILKQLTDSFTSSWMRICNNFQSASIECQRSCDERKHEYLETHWTGFCKKHQQQIKWHYQLND